MLPGAAAADTASRAFDLFSRIVPNWSSGGGTTPIKSPSDSGRSRAPTAPRATSLRCYLKLR